MASSKNQIIGAIWFKSLKRKKLKAEMFVLVEMDAQLQYSCLKEVEVIDSRKVIS